MKGKPTRVVIDFNVYPKLGEALKTHISNINEGRYAPRYSSIAQFIIELLERELKKSSDDWTKQPLNEWTTTTQKK